MIDIHKSRQDTPGCTAVVHFNNAGAALMPTPVIEAMKAHIDLEAKMGGYEAAAAQSKSINETYRNIARLLGAQADDIAIVDSATSAWNSLFHSFAFEPGDEIILTEQEYGSNYLNILEMCRRSGAILKIAPSTNLGIVSLPALEAMISSKTKIICLTYIPTHRGIVQPAAEVGRLANGANVPYLLDACQAVGQFNINVNEIGCDALTTTGRKYLRGPRGTGFLYVRKKLRESLQPPSLDIHSATFMNTTAYNVRSDARRFEQWECNYAARLGLGEAVKYALDLGLNNIEERITVLSRHLKEALGRTSAVNLCDTGKTSCGIVTFTIPHKDPGSIQAKLRGSNINVSVSTFQGTPLDFGRRGIHSLFRASIHYYNTSEEVDLFIETLNEAIKDAK
ncbi:MAG: aminotransferase class V-fold PLP-dependent enzyme [Oligoflexales bacterium]